MIIDLSNNHDIDFCNKLASSPPPFLQILQGLNLDINKGQTVALVGPSGCGKSTVIQLVQRFYDVDSGSILLEGEDIKSLNVGKLRDRCVVRIQRDNNIFCLPLYPVNWLSAGLSSQGGEGEIKLI